MNEPQKQTKRCPYCLGTGRDDICGGKCPDCRGAGRSCILCYRPPFDCECALSRFDPVEQRAAIDGGKTF